MEEEKKEHNQEEKGTLKERFSFKKLNRKFHFLMSHNETMEPIVDFRLNLLNLFFVIIGLALLLIIINTCLITLTPLREYIPGYTDYNLNREVYLLNRRADSLAVEMQKRDVYFENLKYVVEGYDFAADSCHENVNIYEPLPGTATDSIVLRKSPFDKLLRAEFENASQYDLVDNRSIGNTLSDLNFFVPIEGYVKKGFNREEKHFGVDIVSQNSQFVKATLDGTVVLAIWSIDDGYTIGLQHEKSYFSIYRCNSALLKKEGDFVHAGDAIGILDETNESNPSGLHFELWLNGTSVNPTQYMTLEPALGN